MGGAELCGVVLITAGDVIDCLVVSLKRVMDVGGTYVDKEVAAEVKP